MIFDKKCKSARLEVKIAGLRERLKATREIYNHCCEHGVPRDFVDKLIEIPQEIAELEEEYKQLKAKNETP